MQETTKPPDRFIRRPEVSHITSILSSSITDLIRKGDFPAAYKLSERILAAFPDEARRTAGYQLMLVQFGGEPDNWKPMTTVGQGVREIRIKKSDGAFRVMYVAKFEEAVYVLHAFQKKTQKTEQSDIELAQERFKDVVRERAK
ncbi:MAG: hypothetical protein CR991_03085 [Proteobacteria bacterium]|nr:MAG: hypothetical protein CR991_03085 [Pseudomonadota bacterium]